MVIKHVFIGDTVFGTRC